MEGRGRIQPASQPSSLFRSCSRDRGQGFKIERRLRGFCQRPRFNKIGSLIPVQRQRREGNEIEVAPEISLLALSCLALPREWGFLLLGNFENSPGIPSCHFSGPDARDPCREPKPSASGHLLLASYAEPLPRFVLREALACVPHQQPRSVRLAF